MIPERTPKSLAGLRQMVESMGRTHDLSKMTIVEVGSWTGLSACLFAEYFKSVLCIDPFLPKKDTITAHHDMKEVEKIFNGRIAERKNIVHLKHTSVEVLPMLKNVDVVYIDGEHTYPAVKADIKALLS